MSFKYFVLVTIISAFLLFGCNSDADNNDALIPEYEQPRYSANKSSCVDSNLNGQCDIGEVELLTGEQELLANQSPILAVYDDFTLSAVAGSSLITPFTTLINNEVMYNPLVNGSIDQAKSYLTEKLNIDFSKLDKFDGPVSEGNKIISSIIKAQVITSDNRYLPIAAMVDLMVYSNDLKVQTSQQHADALVYPNLLTGNSYLLDEDSNVRFSQFDLHPVTGRAIIVTSDNKLISLNANSGAYTNIENQAKSKNTQQRNATYIYKNSPLLRSNRAENLVSAKDDDDKHNAHDDDDDDDDDDYDDWFDYLNQTRSTDINKIKQHINSNNFFILTSKEATGITDVCNANGDHGLFLSNVQSTNDINPSLTPAKNTTSRRLKISNIDGYTSASTSVPVIDKPTVIPPIFDSEASCYNDAMVTMASSVDSKLLAVVLDDGLGHIIYRLGGANLALTPDFGYRVPDFIELKQIALSANGELLAYTEPDSGKLVLIDTNTMKLLASYQYGNQKLNQVHFSGEQQLAAINTDQEELSFIDIIDNKLILNKTLTLPYPPSILSSNPIAKMTVVANDKNISLIKHNNAEFIIKPMLTDYDNTIEQVAVLSDKVVYTTGDAYLLGADTINYLNANSIIGSPVRAAQQFLTAGIIMQNRTGVYYRSGTFNLPTNLDQYDIEGITIEWSSNRSDEIDLDSGAVNTTLAKGSLLSAKIRGNFRFEPVTITKTFSVN
ncbi:hypothetical protein [Colwellia psychrerythraea]|uniref:Lipoprotein n=1 Tax=Colwellia psychrerythraea TaxID=28229 RepID=A0A099KMR2_COLPS|nr:hypothetical protein [Colwellia psychrerythraea]KGJ91197.1 hypothetical protein GAB14E_3349 [Colwellia psychrerythraea]